MYLRDRAILYAKTWWNKRNPNYYNFDNLGGDCTNFVSQCLHAGGISMNYSYLGWYYNSPNSRSPAWTGVEEFFNFAVNNKSDIGVKVKLCDIYEVKVGDIVQFQTLNKNRYHHTALIIETGELNSLENIKIACHSSDAIYKPLSEYNIEKIRFLKVLN